MRDVEGGLNPRIAMLVTCPQNNERIEEKLYKSPETALRIALSRKNTVNHLS
jgi:hypothetical protein